MRRFALVLSAFIAAACALPILTPPPHDFPCGYHGISCPGTDHMCCDENEVCGGSGEGVDGAAFSGCAPGMCCFVGDPTYAISLHPKHQYQESR